MKITLYTDFLFLKNKCSSREKRFVAIIAISIRWISLKFDSDNTQTRFRISKILDSGHAFIETNLGLEFSD